MSRGVKFDYLSKDVEGNSLKNEKFRKNRIGNFSRA